jgi:putative endopeptidase
MRKQIVHFCLGIILVVVPSLLFGQAKNNVPWVDPLVAHIDTTVKPGTDFFLYANGKWFKENPDRKSVV